MSEGLSYGAVEPQAGLVDYYVDDAPQLSADFLDVRPGIFAGESGGDYGALFGFSNRPGGQWEHVDLTNMTLAEVAQFTDPNGEYGRWVREQLRAAGQDPRIATPTGAYQVVGTTLRGAIEDLGLDPNALYDPGMQDRIGQYIYEQQGTGAWEGYQPGATEPAGGWQPGGDAPSLPGVHAGYQTAPGQNDPDDPARSPYSTLTALFGPRDEEHRQYQQGLDAHGQGLFARGDDGSMNIFGRTLDDQQRQNFASGLFRAGVGLMNTY